MRAAFHVKLSFELDNVATPIGVCQKRFAKAAVIGYRVRPFPDFT